MSSKGWGRGSWGEGGWGQTLVNPVDISGSMTANGSAMASTTRSRYLTETISTSPVTNGNAGLRYGAIGGGVSTGQTTGLGTRNRHTIGNFNSQTQSSGSIVRTRNVIGNSAGMGSNVGILTGTFGIGSLLSSDNTTQITLDFVPEIHPEAYIRGNWVEGPDVCTMYTHETKFRIKHTVNGYIVGPFVTNSEINGDFNPAAEIWGYSVVSNIDGNFSDLTENRGKLIKDTNLIVQVDD